MQRHTNVFHFDFNKQATRRFRESQESQEEATSDEPDVPSYILTDPSLILRMGVDVGFQEEDSSANQDGGKAQDGGDPYV